jgi:hypothetical protein
VPRFLTVHTFPPGEFTPERITEIAAIGQRESDIRGYRSFHSLSEGRIVWILEAADKQVILDWCAKMGLPVDGITQLEMEGHVGVITTLTQSEPEAK